MRAVATSSSATTHLTAAVDRIRGHAEHQRSIVRGDQLVMGFDARDFWAPDEIDKLAAEREIRRVEDVDTRRDREASDEEVDRLLAALDEM